MNGSRQYDSFYPLQNEVGRKDRYSYAKATLGKRAYFIKQALSESEAANLQRELVWSGFMEAIEVSYPDLLIRSLREVGVIDEVTLRTEWIDGTLLSYPGDGKTWLANLERYTGMLVAIDAAAQQYTVPAMLRTYTPRAMQDRMSYWLEGVSRTELMNEAHTLVTDCLDGLEYTMQHGDLTPWQIMVLGDEWVIIDGERSGDDLPRFNDVAYSYGRLAIRCNNALAAEMLLHDFISKRNISSEIIDHQLRPVLLLRLLGMIGDAVKDANKEEYGRAERILMRCINEPLPLSRSS